VSATTVPNTSTSFSYDWTNISSLNSSTVYNLFLRSRGITSPTIQFTTYFNIDLDSTGSGFCTAVDSSRNIYVSDVTNNRVTKYDSFGDQLFVITGTPVRFPTAIAIDSSGNLYVASYIFSTVTKYDSSGSSLMTLTSGVVNPTGLTVDSVGNIYVMNYDNNFIVKYNSVGTQQTTILASSISGLHTGRGIAVDSAGNIYIANDVNNSIIKLNSSGTQQTTGNFPIRTGIQSPRSIAIDYSSGNICVANSTNTNSTVTIYNSSGVLQTTISSTSGIRTPTGVAVDSYNTLYVANSGNYRLSKYDAQDGGWLA
jgi:DNA-binding beta-propeller fold protein YncE